MTPVDQSAPADFHCSRCGAPSPVRAPARQVTAAAFDRMFTRAGWTCASGAVVCPACAARRAPAMPQPELVDEPRVCTTADGLVDALRASLARPAPKPAGLLSPRERAARVARHEERAALARMAVHGGGAS